MPYGKMRVMIQIRARTHHPINETRLHERNDAGTTQSRRGKCSCDAHSHGRVGCENLSGEEVAGLPQPAGVVCLKIVIDEFGHADVLRDWSGYNRLSF